MIIEQEKDLLLKAVAVEAVFSSGLGAEKTPQTLLDMLAIEFSAPVSRDDSVKSAVRDMMRQHGYKPTGRGKPASEYLVKAVSEGRLGSINRCVDVLNVVSLHSGFPISVVDLDKVTQPLCIKTAQPQTSYIFNAGGQEIQVGGLFCLFDSEGPCANGVKDSQRTKTSDTTTRTLSVVWGTEVMADKVLAAVQWYVDLLRSVGAEISEATIQPR